LISFCSYLLYIYPLFKWIFCIQKGEKLSNFRGSKSWRLILLFSVFALVVVACGGDAAEEEVVEEETETTEAPATTEAAAEEEASSAPGGVYKMGIFSDPQTQNYWTYLDTENDVWTSYVMSGQAVSLFTLSVPNYQLVASMATELVETSTDNGDGTFSYTVPITEGFEWSDGTPITANDI
jgi:ABC-type transport system substrate-binding protein